MLYIASALTPTPILASLRIPAFTDPNSTSLIVAKPDKIQVWDVETSGLVHRAELEVWGTIVSIDRAVVEGARPHILVLTCPPNAQLLLVTFASGPNPSLIVTSSIALTPPTPTLRQAEFYTAVIAQDNVALVSLWIGVLSCIELEVEKEKDAKKRRASIAGSGMDVDEDGRRLKFRDNFNINVREHNLLHLSFLPLSTSASGPIVTFLWMTSRDELNLQARTLSLIAHNFEDLTRTTDLLTPLRSDIKIDGNTDFNEVPFSCPAARRVVPIPSDMAGGDKSILVIGDEHTVLYTLSSTPQSPRVSRRLSAASGPGTSPRASARRSPQTELVSSTNKRRKSSMTASGGESKLDIRPVWRIRQGFGTVLAATVLDSTLNGASVLLGDDSGRLTAIGWAFEKNQGILESATAQNGSVRVGKADLGAASPPSALTYLDSAHLFLSSACGDSLLLKLNLPTQGQISRSPISPSQTSIPRKGKGRAKTEDEGAWSVIHEEAAKGSTKVKERWMNLSPVKDFTVVEEEGGGMSHLVISSGAANTNSLRIVRSGVGLEEVTTVEGVEGVERMWTLSDSAGNTRLLLSTASATHLLEVEPEISIVEIANPITSTSTLAAAILPGSDVMIQVTPSSVQLWSDISSGLSAGSVVVDKETIITSAQIYDDLVGIVKRGGEVVLLKVSSSGIEAVAIVQIASEISALSIITLPTLPSPVLAIATWTNGILLYTLEQLKSGNTTATTFSESFYPSSLLLKPSSSPSSESSTSLELLAGLSDGSLVTYTLEMSGEDGSVRSTSRKTSSLGARPLSLVPTTGPKSAGDERILAVGLTERMSVLFESKDRIDFSSVSRKDVTAAASLTSPSFGDVLVLATAQNLSFVKVNSLKKLHVQTLDLGDRSVSRLACLDQKVLATGATVRTMDSATGEVLQSSFLELRDSTSLAPLFELPLKAREEVTALEPVFLLGRQYLALGTAILPIDSDDEVGWDEGNLVNVKEGRVVLFEARSTGSGEGETWDLKSVVSVDTVGAVYDLAVIHGFLAIAAGSKVSINRLSPSSGTLEELSSFSSIFVASHLAIVKAAGEKLVIGDGMRSIVLLDIDEESGKIHDDSRDMATHSVMGMESVRDGGEGVVIVDGYDNILTFRLKEGIESAATFGLHEEIARFTHGSLAPASSASETLRPDLLFATRSGRLGMIGELTAGAAKTLDDLQRNLERYWRAGAGVGSAGPAGGAGSGPAGAGVLGWKIWRRGGNEVVKRDTAGFIDGDYVQKFADADIFPSPLSDRILQGGSSLEHIMKVSSGGVVEPANRGEVLRVLDAAGGLH